MITRAIVCVDDELIVLDSLKEQLKRCFGNNYYIEVAESGEEALLVIEELQKEGIEIPLIISDQIMPRIQGDELLIKIHAQHPKMLKILLTGQASREAVVNAVNSASLYRYVSKPWDEADLNLTVTEALRSYLQDQQLEEQNEALQKINKKLEKLNASLEDKVNERTAKLAKAEAEMQGIFTAMTELIFVFDMDGRFIKIASNNPTLLPYSSDLLIGKTLHEVYELKQANTFLEYIKQALTTQKTVSVEYSLVINGQQIWCAANITPISDDSVIWVIRDMTKRKFLEDKLRSSEEKIRAIFEAMTDIILVIDEQGAIEVAPTNPGRFYKSELDLINLTIEQFFMEERGKVWFDKARQALKLQEALNFDYSLPFGDQEIWFSTSISALPNQSVIWVARDISVRKLAEAAMQEAKEAAIAANLAKSTFLANMSHELRSPLNIILGFSQLMIRSKSLNVENQENIGRIIRSGEHLLALINNVLDLSKIEAGRTTLDLIDFNVHQLLDDLEAMFQVNASENCLKLVFSRSPDVPQYICTDQLKLRQVLINLINNSLKFTQDGTILVRVTVLAPPTKLIDVGNSQENFLFLGFEVEDTGIGIASEELESIFEAFTQAQTSRNCAEGTGLGLSISRKFVELMGGNITASSQVGHGSIFKFSIKVSNVNATDIENQAPTRRVIALEPNQPSYRILVVDDKWSNRQLLFRLLNPIGFEIREASNGKEAIEIWESFEPHLIWMDMRMPVMDGYEATRYIKSQLKGQATAILALTASTLEVERSIILSTGCDDFVRKPFREEIIFDKMAEYLAVRYVYEELASTTTSKVVNTGLSLQEVLASVPLLWVEQLYEAANLIDNEQILELLQQLEPNQAFFKQTLTDWVNSFRCDRIIDLIELYRQER